MRLKGVVIIVTGSATGIGKSYAQALAQEGAKVVVADINGPEAKKVSDSIIQGGGDSIDVQVDVSVEGGASRIAREAIEHFNKIDVLINNAAIYKGIRYKPFDQVSIEEWERMMRVNVRGSWLCAKAVFPYMKKQMKGKVVNISSSSYFVGAAGLVHYVASKGAIIGLTRALARELGQYNITVNCLAPGYTLSESSVELNPSESFNKQMAEWRSLRRNEYPEDLTGTMVYLCSSDSDFLTGQTILVDGGRTMH